MRRCCSRPSRSTTLAALSLPSVFYAFSPEGVSEKLPTLSQEENLIMTTTPKPVDEVRFGAVKAAIWRNETDNGSRFNVTFSRSYRDSEGEWKSTSSFRRDDLLVLAKIADRVHSRIFALQREDRKDRHEESDQS